MSEPTCRTCANIHRYVSGTGGWCHVYAVFDDVNVPAPDCYVRPESCPPPGFRFTKRDGTKAQCVPRNDRKPGSPWAWPVCPECKGKGGGTNFHHWAIKWRCPDCYGTGDLRPAEKQHEVKR